MLDEASWVRSSSRENFSSGGDRVDESLTFRVVVIDWCEWL